MAIEFDNLHTILRSLYQEMMPLCSNISNPFIKSHLQTLAYG